MARIIINGVEFSLGFFTVLMCLTALATEAVGTKDQNLFDSQATMKHLCPNAKMSEDGHFYACSEGGKTWFVGINKSILTDKLPAASAE